MAKDDEKRDTSQTPSKPQNARNPTTENQDEIPTSASATLASRIQNSASGLARSAFSVPGQTQDLAGSLASSEKAGPSASTSTGVGQSSGQAVDDQFGRAAGSAAAWGNAGAPGETFRSSTQPGRGDMTGLTEEQFEGTYDAIHNVPASIHETGAATGKGKERANEDAFDTAWHRSSHPPPTTTTPSAPDGAAVVSLLSDSTFSPDFPIEFDTDTDTPPAPLTAAEIDMLKTFQRHLPPPPAHQHRLTSSSLVPDIDSILSSAPAAGGVETDATALRDHVLAGLPGAADWMAVEERYHDEVWGYLRPTLEAAAREMEEKKESGTGTGEDEDGPAVRRLKMILKHM